MSKVLYPGSFDMFTKGHLSVLKQAVDVFDEVIICISHNPAKHRRFTIDSCLDAIRAAVKNACLPENKITVVISQSTIPAQIAKEYNCGYIARGIRNTSDYLYEDQLAAFNTAFDSNIKTIYFRAENSEVSSTMVTTLLKECHPDACKYLPYDSSILKAANVKN